MDKRCASTQTKTVSMGDGAVYKTKVRDMMETRKTAAPKGDIDEEDHLTIYGGVEGEDRDDEDISTRLSGRGARI